MSKPGQTHSTAPLVSDQRKTHSTEPYEHSMLGLTLMDIRTKPLWFRRKLFILHRKMHIAHCNISQYNETLNIRVNPLTSDLKKTHSTEPLVSDPRKNIQSQTPNFSPQLQPSFLVARIHIAHSNMHFAALARILWTSLWRHSLPILMSVFIIKTRAGVVEGYQCEWDALTLCLHLA